MNFFKSLFSGIKNTFSKIFRRAKQPDVRKAPKDLPERVSQSKTGYSIEDTIREYKSGVGGEATGYYYNGYFDENNKWVKTKFDEERYLRDARRLTVGIEDQKIRENLIEKALHKARLIDSTEVKTTYDELFKNNRVSLNKLIGMIRNMGQQAGLETVSKAEMFILNMGYSVKEFMTLLNDKFGLNVTEAELKDPNNWFTDNGEYFLKAGGVLFTYKFKYHGFNTFRIVSW